ncbi:hypothetical protein E2562_026245 [Oryza meyeriana var. granulata]|uniref:Uncharacterized protein n=1 Tax=Oryza meyeriana var. granulata TaxID=110450 RepID=A0A6G1CK58_9ORYZ|nr:hypothetical protein E2562_026245 [Oryza meyeriana var. granulata]
MNSGCVAIAKVLLNQSDNPEKLAEFCAGRLLSCAQQARNPHAGGGITGDGEEESQMCRRLVPEASLMEMRGGLVDEPWLGLQLVKIVREVRRAQPKPSARESNP